MDFLHKEINKKNEIKMMAQVVNNGKASVRNEEYNSEDKPVPILYERKEDCTGCTACYSICPKHAIEMFDDEEGFLYPSIDAKECIRCMACIWVCPVRQRDLMAIGNIIFFWYKSDEEKSEIAFDVAKNVFFDQYAEPYIDKEKSTEKSVFYNAFGAVEGEVIGVLFTVPDEANEVIRIISAWKSKH